MLEPLAGQQVGGLAVDSPERRLFAALASATVASVHRQLGLHASAAVIDEAGLALTDGTGEAAFDCLLGLAADAVGQGDAERAQARLAEASALAAGRDDWWRQRVRQSWVEAELALLRRRPGPRDRGCLVGGPPGRGLRGSSPRCQEPAVPGCGAGAGRRADRGQGTLRRASTLAESLGTLPLLWPARALLGALLEASAPAESAKSLVRRPWCGDHDGRRPARGATAVAGPPDITALLGGD